MRNLEQEVEHYRRKLLKEWSSIWWGLSEEMNKAMQRQSPDGQSKEPPLKILGVLYLQ
jgi:hypothetical protein